MTSVYDVPPQTLIKETATKLKGFKELQPPVWAAFAKTGMHKERPPVENDWWYVRAAAILRSVYRLGPVGVSKLRRKYGGKKNRGHKPDKFFKGSGSILRHILQQLEKAELVKQTKKGVHKGRVIAPKGKSLLDKTASELKKRLQAGQKVQAKPVQHAPVAEKKVKEETSVEKPKVQMRAPQKQG